MLQTPYKILIINQFCQGQGIRTLGRHACVPSLVSKTSCLNQTRTNPVIVGKTGLEPATPCSQSTYSSQLNYIPIFNIIEESGTLTHTVRIGVGQVRYVTVCNRIIISYYLLRLVLGQCGYFTPPPDAVPGVLFQTPTLPALGSPSPD